MRHTVYKTGSLGTVGKFFIYLFDCLKLISIEHNVGEGGMYTQVNNLTLINLALRVFGPLHEKKLTTVLLILQILSSVIAFVIGYQMDKIFYDS